jgi:hypothetical protein
MTTTTYPVIRNCNYSARRDDLGKHVAEAVKVADRGCDDSCLIDALDALEATLEAHAESDHADSERLCTLAEEAVEAALVTVQSEQATAAAGRGMHYRSAEWQRLAERCQWQGIWPVIDADGELTGEISEGSEEESNVDDEAMIDTDDARAAGWKVEDGYASPPQPVAVEFAVADETIRTCAIDDLIGLEHTAAAEACAAYHRAATQSLIDDTRAGRLTVSSPRGQRRLHSQWMGSYWRFSAGAIGTMGDLTEDEKAAVSAADDAGREAARKIVKAAEAAEIQ